MTSAQEEELLPDWPMRVRWADSRKVRLGEPERVAGKALRQGRLVEEEEVFATTNSSSCTVAGEYLTLEVLWGQESRQAGLWQA